jgi:hypothetical protein
VLSIYSHVSLNDGIVLRAVRLGDFTLREHHSVNLDGTQVNHLTCHGLLTQPRETYIEGTGH